MVDSQNKVRDQRIDPCRISTSASKLTSFSSCWTGRHDDPPAVRLWSKRVGSGWRLTLSSDTSAYGPFPRTADTVEHQSHSHSEEWTVVGSPLALRAATAGCPPRWRGQWCTTFLLSSRAEVIQRAYRPVRPGGPRARASVPHHAVVFLACGRPVLVPEVKDQPWHCPRGQSSPWTWARRWAFVAGAL